MIRFDLKNKKGPARTCLRGGFTLVEMMVAIAVFSVVMVTAMSALLNVVDANNKARAIKTAINNISFALEGISKDMRMGTDYACFTGQASTDCPTGGAIIKYRSPRADLDATTNKRKFAWYKFDDGQIKECLEKGSVICRSDGPFTPVTSKEVTITANSKFYVLGTQFSKFSPPLKTQPRIIITISGEAGSKEKTKTQFDLQTGVSQRTRIE